MGILDKLFGKKKKIEISPIYNQEIDSYYELVQIELIGMYQHHFDRIIKSIDVNNYTKWSLSQEHNKEKLQKEDDWMYDQFVEIENSGLKGGLLQNMINQYFFADQLMREMDKSSWVKRVLYRKYPNDYFPDGSQMRGMMNMLQ